MNLAKIMKLLFVIDYFGSGGAQRQMVNLAVGLKRKGHQVDFFCYYKEQWFEDKLQAENIQIFEFTEKVKSPFKIISSLAKIIKKNHYDLIMSFLLTPNLYTLLASKLAMKNIKIVMGERNCDLSDKVQPKDHLTRLLYRFSNQVVTNTHYQKNFLQRRYPDIRGKISTIYNGYDLEEFHPLPNYPGNHPVEILVISSVLPRKNGVCLIEALQYLQKQYQYFPKVKWAGQIYLTGEPYDYFQQMERKISEGSLSSQWQWLKQRKDIVSLLHQSDLLVHTSYKEGLPNVICEAMACARPVIAGNALELPCIIMNGDNGLLFDLNDPIDLAEKIYSFSNLTFEEKMRMGMSGRKFAEENLTNSKMINSYEALFFSLIL